MGWVEKPSRGDLETAKQVVRWLSSRHDSHRDGFIPFSVLLAVLDREGRNEMS